MAEVIDIQIKNNIPEVEESSKDLRKEIKELKKTMYSLQEGTEEYDNCLTELANKMHEMSDLNESLKNSAGDLGTLFTNMTKVTADVTAGFSAVNAVSTLLGSNGEDLQKTMVKLQSAMALVQGLQGLEGIGKHAKALVTSFTSLTKGVNVFKISLKGIKTAIAETGIGLLVIALATLAANFDKIIDKISGAQKALDDMKADNEAYSQSMSDLNMEYDHNIKMMGIHGATQEEQAQAYRDQREEIVKTTQAKVDETQATIDSLEANRHWWNSNKKLIEEQEKYLEQYQSDAKKANEDLKKSEYSLLEAKEQAAVDDEKAKKKAEEEKRKAAESAAKKAQDAILAAEKKITDSYRTAVNDIIKTNGTLETAFDTLISQSSEAASEANENFENLYSDAAELEGKKQELFRRTYNSLTAAAEKAKMDIDRLNSAGTISEEETANKKLQINETYVKDVQNLIDKMKISYASVSEDGKVDLDIPAYITQLSDINKEFENSYNYRKTLKESEYLSEEDYNIQVKSLYDEYANNVRMKMDEVKQTLDKQLGDGTITQEEYVKQLSWATQTSLGETTGFVKSVTDEIQTYNDTVSEQIRTQLENSMAAIDTNINTAITTAEGKITELTDELDRFRLANENTFSELFNFNDIGTAFSNIGELFNGILENQYNKEVEYNNQVYELRNQEYQQVMDQLNSKLELEGLSAEERLATEQEVTNMKIAMQANETEKYKKNIEARNKLDQTRSQIVNATTSTMSGAFSSLADALGEENKAYKGLKVAGAVMDALGAANSAYASMASIPYVGPALGAIAAAAALVSGYANVKQILAVDPETGSGSSSTASSSASTPTVTASMLSADAMTTLMGDESQLDLQETIASTQSETKVYVTESDISDTQNSVKTKVSESTF